MSGGAIRFTLEPLAAPAGLAREWRQLAALAGASFFQRWTWTGTWLDHLPEGTRVLLLRGQNEAGTVLLGLFVAAPVRFRGMVRRRALLLAEAGRLPQDGLAIEHNGFLVHPTHPEAVGAALRFLTNCGEGWDLLRFSGLDAPTADEYMRQSDLPPRILARKACPVLDLDRVREAGGDPIAWLGRNTRAAARRTFRLLEEAGTPSLRAARDIEEAQAMFTRLIGWHQERWRRRGAPGAFADPWSIAFHRALIARGLPGAEVELLQLEVDGAPRGVLYNFRAGDRVLNYQGGFDMGGGRDQRPGLALHLLAIARHAAEGAAVYDHLAGENPLKRSLASRSEEMVWLELWRDGTLIRIEDLARRARAALRRRLSS